MLDGAVDFSEKQRFRQSVVGAGLGGKRCPVHAERVAFNDVRARFERQKVDSLTDEPFGFRNHLAFGNPERGFCDGNGKVVYFDAVKIVDFDADGIFKVAHERLTAKARGNAAVFKAAEAQIRFRQKVAAAAGGIKELQSAELFLKVQQFLLPHFCLRNVHNLFEFGSKSVHKKRIDYFMDIFDARVMHSARAPRFGIERTFKHRAENRGTNFAPVERRAMFDDNGNDFRRKIGNLDVLCGKKSAVYIGEGSQRGVVFVARVDFRVQSLEQIDERFAEIFRTEGLYVVFECSF